MEDEEEFDMENPFFLSSSSSKENMELLFRAEETQHSLSPAYFQSLHSDSPFPKRRRRRILSFILRFSILNSHPFLSYLALNYMDRFLSLHPISITDYEKPWISKLITIACVSLASKMMKIDFRFSDFHQLVMVDDDEGEGMKFDVATVGRMENLILGTLKWRMRSVTPFCFLNFFMSFMVLKDETAIEEVKTVATAIIFKAQHDAKLLEFKPSVIAASTLLRASHEVIPTLLPSLKTSFANCENINKNNLFKCYNYMTQELPAIDGYDSSFAQPSSPNWVNVECFSSPTSGNKRMREINLCRDVDIRIPKCLKFENE